MKKTVMIIGFCLSCLLAYSQTENKKNADDIFRISYNDYIGGEVFNLLLHDNIRSYRGFIFLDNESKPCVLAGAIVEIGNNIDLEIYIAKPKYVVPNDDCKWDKQLFYKETINRIRVFHHEVCVIDTNPLTGK